MTGDIFGNLREWGHVPGQLAQLTEAGALDGHQEGLIRLLRYRHNWRLREMALEAIQQLRSPTDRLVSEVLAILMDEGLYYEVRVLAAKSLSALLTKNASQYRRDRRSVLCGVLQRFRTLLDSPQPPVMHEALRECLAVLDQAEPALRASVTSLSQC